MPSQVQGQSLNYEAEHAAFKLVNKGYNQLNNRKYEEAISTLKEALRYGSTRYTAGILSAMGDAYRGLKQYPQAIQCLKESLKANPRESSTYYTYALVYLDSKRYEDALSALRFYKSVETSPKELKKADDLAKEINCFRYLEPAQEAIKAGHNVEAKELLLKVCQQDPSPVSGVAHRQLAYVFRNMGNSQQAIVECENSLKYEPRNKSVNYTIGMCYKDLGKVDEAIAYIKRFAQSESDPGERAKAQEFIRDLEDDREKLSDPSNNQPDYFDLLVAQGEAHPWAQASMPLKIYIGRADGLQGYRPNFTQIIIKAYDAWGKASGNKLAFLMVDNPANCDIEIEWTTEDLFKEEGGRRRAAAGITQNSPAHNMANPWQIGHSKIRIQTINCFSREDCTDDDILSTSLHEVGHSLGIGGHSANFSDIMFMGNSNRQLPALTRRDKATMARLYQHFNTLAAGNPQSP